VRWFLALSIATLAGCSCDLDHITLDDRWRPLKRIQKQQGIAEGIYSTVGEVILTSDPCEFLRADPVSQNGLLRHEQLHALRQQEIGYVDYIRRYAVDLGFRADEERAAWHLQIDYVVKHGGAVDPDYIASVFTEHYMVWTREAVIAWVNSEIAAAKAGR